MQAVGSVNATLLDLIRAEPIGSFCLLDVGCGSGALTFALAPGSRYVIGIDILADRIEEARGYAVANSVTNVSFTVGDAYTTDYRGLGSIDMVVSHLCMSDEIVKRSYEALDEGRPFAFVCFHSENLKELGRRSRFSYSESRMRRLLLDVGFKVEYLEVEIEKVEFGSKREALDYFDDSTKARLRGDGRWGAFLSYLDEGGRSVTRSRLVVKARR